MVDARTRETRELAALAAYDARMVVARRARRRVSKRDVEALSRIQDQVWKLAQRAANICDRIEVVNEAEAEYAREQFVRPMEAAAVGGDDAIRVAEEALKSIDIVTRIGDLARGKRAR